MELCAKTLITRGEGAIAEGAEEGSEGGAEEGAEED